MLDAVLNIIVQAYIGRLQLSMIRRRRGVKEAAIRADMIKLFPATACSVWQDALYPSHSATNGTRSC
jgi:hypothetical protein